MTLIFKLHLNTWQSKSPKLIWLPPSQNPSDTRILVLFWLSRFQMFPSGVSWTLYPWQIPLPLSPSLTHKPCLRGSPAPFSLLLSHWPISFFIDQSENNWEAMFIQHWDRRFSDYDCYQVWGHRGQHLSTRINIYTMHNNIMPISTSFLKALTKSRTGKLTDSQNIIVLGLVRGAGDAGYQWEVALSNYIL